MHVYNTADELNSIQTRPNITCLKAASQRSQDDAATVGLACLNTQDCMQHTSHLWPIQHFCQNRDVVVVVVVECTD